MRVTQSGDAMPDFLCKHSNSASLCRIAYLSTTTSGKHRSPATTRPGCYAEPLRGAARRALLAARVAVLAFTASGSGGRARRSSERPAESGTERRRRDVGSSGAAGSRGCLQQAFLCLRPEQKGFSPPGMRAERQCRERVRGQSHLKSAPSSILSSRRALLTWHSQRRVRVHRPPIKGLPPGAYY